MANQSRSVIRTVKFGFIAILAIVVLIIALQNTANVETRLLFATVTMPRAVLLFVMLGIGFVIGWLSWRTVFTYRQITLHILALQPLLFVPELAQCKVRRSLVRRRNKLA